MQRNANMLKILKNCVFADFIGFFAKMQSPVCPPPERTFILRQNFTTRYVSGVCKIINGH